MTTQSLAVQDINSFVFASNDEIKTDSLKVAEAFGKLHKNVLQSIARLECSEEFERLNFQLVEYDYINNKGHAVKQPKYEMTKDGFMFLVMGFTGKAAAQIKEAYINAFNLMHAKLFPKTAYGLKDLLDDDRMTLISKRELERLRKVPPKPLAWGEYATMMLALPADQRLRWVMTNHAGTTVIHSIEPDVLVGTPEHVIRELKILGYHVIKDDPQNKLETIGQIVSAQFVA